MKRRQFTWNTITTMLNLIIQFGLSFFFNIIFGKNCGRCGLWVFHDGKYSY